MELPSLEEEATMSEPFFDDPYEYGEADEIKPGDAGTEDELTPDIPVTKEMRDAIDMILGCCPGQVFFSRDFPQALILADDSTWIARVNSDGSTEEAYLSTEPLETLVSVKEDTFTASDLPELQGFTTGFTC